MLIKHNREKLLNSIIYFIKNTKYCGKTKLFKLLYFLDFKHFKQTGRSVTGLEYYAWHRGPVPKELFEELDNPKEDMKQCLFVPDKHVLADPDIDEEMPLFKLLGKCKFDESHFTKRELKILDDLAFIFKEARSKDMVDSTHLRNQPWHRTYNNGSGFREKIDYMLALDNEPDSLSPEIVKERVLESREMELNFGE